MDYANATSVVFMVDPKALFRGWLIYSYLQIFKLIKCKWLPGECADWFFHNIITWSYCLHRRYSISRQKNRMSINVHALNREPVPSSFTFLLNTHTLSTYLKNAGLFSPHASLLQVALTVVELTDWLFLRISKSICSETIFAGFCCPWKKNEFSLLIHLNSIKLAWRNRRPHLFPRELTSEKRVQKIHTDDASLTRSG